MKKLNVLLTGSSRGIGKAIKETLTATDLYEVAAPTRAVLDLRSDKSIDDYFSCVNTTHFDILINNAGINILETVDQLDRVSMDQMIKVNLTSPLQLISKVAIGMKGKKMGRIINISSIWGISSKEKRTLYSMTKFGINGITKALSKELGPYNILINSICPGYVNTEMTQQNVPPLTQKDIEKSIPLRRFAEPIEIAKLVEFLISPNNTYITGQNIIIDGGFL